MPVKIFLMQVFLLLFIGVSGFSQSPVRPYVIHYDSRTYHADYQNWSVTVCPDETIYFGNNKGLLEFDGLNWKLYHMPDNLVVRSVNALNDSIIYVGAYEEFGYWKRDIMGRLNYISLSDSLDSQFFHNDEIWQIIFKDDKVYFQSFSSIYIYDGQNTEIIKPPFTIVLLQKCQNRLFIHGVHQGLFELIGNKLRLIPASRFLANDEIKVVLPFHKDQFLIGSATNGLFIYKDDRIISWDIPSAHVIANSEINKGILLGDHIIIGTIGNGIFILDKSGKVVQHMYSDNLLQNNTVLALTCNEDNLWVGLEQGIEFIQLNSKLDFYFNNTGMLGSVLAASLEGEKLWIGTNRGLFKYLFDTSSGFSDPVFVENSQGSVYDLESFDGELFCGHSNGTYEITNDHLTEISSHKGGYELKRIESGSRNYIIQSTYSPLVLYQKTSHDWQLKQIIKGFLEPITHFEIDYQGNIWGNHTIKGIFKIQLNEKKDSVRHFEYIGKNKGLPNERDLFVSKLEKRIVFTTGMGLYTYDDLQDTIIYFTQLNRELGEYKNAVRIFPFDNNNYWFILKDKIGWFEINNQSVKKIYEYNYAQQDIYFSPNNPHIEILNDSLHLFCLDNGFAILNVKKLPGRPSRPVIYFRKIIARNNKNESRYLSLNPRNRTTILPYSFRNLEITFTSDQFTSRPAFRYYLDGLENNWNEWNENSNVVYSRLPQGHYKFKVITRNTRCIPSNIYAYSFYIRPPWYASDMAKILGILLIMAGGFLARTVFLKRLKKHARRLKEIEKEKRKRERMEAERKYIRLNNEKLQSEVNHQNIQLANRAMTIIKKNELMNQIKKELHNIKSRLRFENGSLDRELKRVFTLIDKNINSEEDWREFEMHFDQTNQNFFKRLKLNYPQLTPSDLRLCAYLRMNLSSKELAPLLNISLRGVEIKRYRLRKRLNLESEENLIEFLIKF